jgi:cytochrome c-type biogenesis protein
MDFLQQLLYHSNYSILTAFILGLMTAISPCPLATNITAMGFISSNLEDKRRVFYNGVVYTFGRAVSYTGLAVLLFLGASKMNVSLLFQGWGEKVLGPLLIVIGVVMLDIFKLKFPALSRLTQRIGEKGKGSYLGAFLLGIVFALAFCPYSGVLYFALLIPMTVASASGLFLPVVFAIATGIPVIIFSWLLAFAVSNVGKLYNRLKVFEYWFRRMVAVLFILVGMYYIYVLL